MWAKIILANSRAKSSARLTAIALAELSDRDGYASATAETLAGFCHHSPRQVRRDIDALVKLGEVAVVDPGGGRGRAPVYLITLTACHPFPRQKRVVKDDIHIQGLADFKR